MLVAELIKNGWIVTSSEAPATVQLMINAAHHGVAVPFTTAATEIAADIRQGKRGDGGEGWVYSKVAVHVARREGSFSRSQSSSAQPPTI
ncbi:hypothetical protein ACMDCR_12770 [Labrys okinawensis]|uniref:hypothetical protein n=1 Tax=Labrys okinawensis TaxID=346911 RepID=UPI0039BD0B6F